MQWWWSSNHHHHLWWWFCSSLNWFYDDVMMISFLAQFKLARVQFAMSSSFIQIQIDQLSIPTHSALDDDDDDWIKMESTCKTDRQANRQINGQATGGQVKHLPLRLHDNDYGMLPNGGWRWWSWFTSSSIFSFHWKWVHFIVKNC